MAGWKGFSLLRNRPPKPCSPTGQWSPAAPSSWGLMLLTREAPRCVGLLSWGSRWTGRPAAPGSSPDSHPSQAAPASEAPPSLRQPHSSCAKNFPCSRRRCSWNVSADGSFRRKAATPSPDDADVGRRPGPQDPPALAWLPPGEQIRGCWHLVGGEPAPTDADGEARGRCSAWASSLPTSCLLFPQGLRRKDPPHLWGHPPQRRGAVLGGAPGR